jgi:hypothetical protein
MAHDILTHEEKEAKRLPEFDDAYYVIHREIRGLIDSGIGNQQKLMQLLIRISNGLSHPESPMYCN